MSDEIVFEVGPIVATTVPMGPHTSLRLPPSPRAYAVRPREEVDLSRIPHLHNFPDPEAPPHPSLLCRCPERDGEVAYEDHLPGCPWRAQMCTACHGTGHCSFCFGDGCRCGPAVKSSQDPL